MDRMDLVICVKGNVDKCAASRHQHLGYRGDLCFNHGNRTMTSQNQSVFGHRVSVEQVEEGLTLSPKFDGEGLIPVVTTDAESGELLMHGYMNAEALSKTIETAEAHYWSRSRNVLWHKGATSGLVQRVVEMRIDDDQDAVWSVSYTHLTLPTIYSV